LMSRLLLTAAVLAVLVYTMVLGVRWLSPRIEQDIAGRVTTGLAEQGLLWADVAVEGRDVVLSGQAPDAEAKGRAMSVATRVFGVSKVQDNIVVFGDVSGTDVVSGTAEVKVEAPVKAVKPAQDYALNITKDGDKVVLEGAVPDEASKEVLVRLASTHYGAENVNAEALKIVEGAPAGWRSAVGAVLMHISNMEQAKAIISNTEVMVSGSVLDKQYSDKMELDVTQVLPKDYKVAFAVEVVTPTVANVEPAAGADVSETAAVACESDVDLKAQTLRFGFDKADLTADHKGKVAEVAKKLKACEGEKLVVAGYTDVTGSPLYNKWLSEQRADATLRGLMRDGVAKDRLKSVGYGDQYPVASNATRDGRAQNRRVEFHAGADLPHAAVEVKKDAPKAAAPAKTVTKKVEKAAVAPKADVKTEVKADAKAAKVSATSMVSETAAVVSETTTKPWWARKTVSETAVEVK
ncbi:MAG: BON domain-containing protein, partial [Alphaproteobacteria bacterium]